MLSSPDGSGRDREITKNQRLALLQKGLFNSWLPPVVVILERSEGSQGGVDIDNQTFLHFGQYCK